MAQDQFTLNGTPILEDDLRNYLDEKHGQAAAVDAKPIDPELHAEQQQRQVDEMDAQIANLQEQRSRVLQS